jgi:glycosyltransferase involved in cell wall biosynthesis
MKMKIQLQNTLFYPATGGIENYLYYASKTLLKLGHEPTILCSQHNPNLHIREVYDDIEIIRYPRYHLPKPLFAFNLFYYVKSLQKFIRNNSKDVDAIWARHPYCAYASCKALPKNPIIYIQATVWPFFLRYAYERLNIIRKIAFKVQNSQDYYIEKKAMEMCDKIVVLSKIRMREISDFYKWIKVF